MKNKIELIVESNDGILWGRVEEIDSFTPTGQGQNLEELIINVKDSIEDYLEHEGKSDKFWNKVNLEKLEFIIRYDLEAFFEEFDFLNLSKVAEITKINRSLLNQYSKGLKHPSIDQVKKIETTIHKLARKMEHAVLVS